MAYSTLGRKWGEPTYGITGGIVYWSFATTQGDITRFSTRISDEGRREVVREAFQAWENVANIDFVEVVDTPQVAIRLAMENIDGVGGTLAIAHSRYIGSRITEVEIGFDSADSWTLPEFKETALHEIGHSIGLGHVNDRTVIMHSSSRVGPELKTGDIEGAQFIYGSKVTQPTLGDDFLIATSGPDVFDGLSGTDTVKFEGFSESFQVSSDDATNAIFVRSFIDGSTDRLVNIERLQFNDGFLAFDEFSNAGAAYRLYQAAFDRTPDAPGLGFWIRQIDGGNVNLQKAAEYFLSSAEFASTYGVPESLSNDALLTLLYSNVLDRTPDQSGFDFWQTHQDNGLSRAEMIVYFAESHENVAQTSAAIDDGIWYV